MDVKKPSKDGEEKSIDQRLKDVEMFIEEIFPYLMKSIEAKSGGTTEKDDLEVINLDEEDELSYSSKDSPDSSKDLPDLSKDLSDLSKDLSDLSEKLTDSSEKLSEVEPLSDEELNEVEVKSLKGNIERKQKLDELSKKLDDKQNSSNKLLRAISIRKIKEKISEIVQQVDSAYENAANVYGKRVQKYAEEHQGIKEAYEKELKRILKYHKLNTDSEYESLSYYQAEKRKIEYEEVLLKCQKTKFINSHRRDVHKILKDIKHAMNKHDNPTYYLSVARLDIIQNDYEEKLPLYDSKINEKHKKINEIEDIIKSLKRDLEKRTVDTHQQLENIRAIRNEKNYMLDKPKFLEKILYSGLFKSYKGIKRFTKDVVVGVQKGLGIAKEIRKKMHEEYTIKSAENSRRKQQLELEKANRRVENAKARVNKMEEKANQIKEKIQASSQMPVQGITYGSKNEDKGKNTSDFAIV